MNMTKIFHWVFGSFFRTLGRILGYLIIGVILALILSNAKLPKVSDIFNDLFFMKVDALSLDGNISRTIQLDSSSYNFFLDNEYQSDTWNINDFNSNEDDYIVIPVKGIKYFINKEEVSSDNYLVSLEKSYIQAYIVSSTSGYTRSCEFQNNLLVCPLGHNQTYTSITLNRWTGGRPGTDSEDDLEVRIQLDNYPQLYKKDTNSIIDSQNQNTQSIINNQNQNNQAVINNQNANTNATIENQNQNTQQQIESQQVCKQIDKQNIKIEKKYLYISGQESTDNNFGITDYINIFQSKVKILQQFNSQYNIYSICYYNVNKTLISCESLANKTELTIPNNTYYFRSSIRTNDNRPTFEVCQNGNQAMANTITDSNVSEANSSASGFFNDFSTSDNGGLSSIITAPLSAIQSLTSSTCSPLVLPLPYINENLTLPCMRTIYEENFGGFIVIYDVITIGIISYWILVRIFNLVKDFKNPDHDEIEVVDL